MKVRMKSLGKKIVVVGVSASGKSSFARELGAKTNLPVVFMDSIMWKPGWNYIGDEEVIKRLDEESLKSEWIIEGYIEKGARPFVFERADTVIYLDYAPIVSSWRYIKRWWKHRKNPRPELEGSPEKFSFKFLKLVWTKGETWSLDKFLAQIPDQSKIIKLHSPQEANSFLAKLGV
jgi:adenylate kinase family enzyme